MHRNAANFIMILLGMVFLLSCAGGPANYSNRDNPVMPDLTDVPGAQSESLDSDSAEHYLWGYYTVFVDPLKNEYEIIPLRQTSDHWNILKWLEQSPCTNCVQITSFTNSDHGTKLIDVKITHPFPIANFTGFDVRGIAIFNGSIDFTTAGLTASDRSLGDGELINPDGYTTLYNSGTAGDGPGGLQGYLKGKFATVTPPDALLNGYIRCNTSAV